MFIVPNAKEFSSALKNLVPSLPCGFLLAITVHITATQTNKQAKTYSKTKEVNSPMIHQIVMPLASLASFSTC